MPRAYWKGFLRLSLVTCPIEIFPATSQAEKTHFHLINTETGHRLRQQIGREHPAEQMKAAKLADDGRHGRRHDRRFHGGHENGHHAGGRYGAPADEKVG